MSEGSALITKPRDYSNIINLDDPGALEEFLNQPLTFIAESITGALAVGKNGLVLSGGRIVQALLKGRLFKQWAAEFKKLRETGRIPDDFADKKYGFQTWVELMTIIDEESPDADRLAALKAMFFAVNNVGATDGERIKAYQLWQIAKQLNSGELLLLRTVYLKKSLYASETIHPNYLNVYSNWASYMAKAIGHGSQGLVDLHEKRPTEFGLLIEKNRMTGTIDADNARLSELGLMFCANIENYELEIHGNDNAE